MVEHLAHAAPHQPAAHGRTQGGGAEGPSTVLKPAAFSAAPEGVLETPETALDTSPAPLGDGEEASPDAEAARDLATAPFRQGGGGLRAARRTREGAYWAGWQYGVQPMSLQMLQS